MCVEVEDIYGIISPSNFGIMKYQTVFPPGLSNPTQSFSDDMNRCFFHRDEPRAHSS